jgi:DNA modification methylase/predicted RNA-binding Zn-ribbon protein involved in translation (DUF1610 family)
MEPRKLTKEDIDKVRDIEGFPIGTDEDIIALSDAPYYTACPNPFIEEFIKENGTPYDEETDDYHREPFAADVSEGKNDIIYSAHNYHTKVPPKAVMRYILHYTKPGDIVLDGFSGSGMVGVAAQSCGRDMGELMLLLKSEQPDLKWGKRRVILNDLSPAATFITYNQNRKVNAQTYHKEATQFLLDCEKEYGWMYETEHHPESDQLSMNTSLGNKGRINYTVWSDVFVCPTCGEEIIFTEAMAKSKGNLKDAFSCQNCNRILKKKDCERVKEIVYDDLLEKTVSIAKQVPVLINYTFAGKKYEKVPDQDDLELIKRISETKVKYRVPITKLPAGPNTDQPRKSHGVEYLHQFYTHRNLLTISTIYEKLRIFDETQRASMVFTFEQILMGMAKIARYVPSHYSQVNQYLSGTLYIGSQVVEVTPRYIIENKINTLEKVFSVIDGEDGDFMISTGSTTELTVPDNCIDYIFTDPPFGANLNYSELSFIWEGWHEILTNNSSEAIMNSVQGKGLLEYQQLMTECFKEYYRVLKPNRWMTVEFHNSQNAVWNAIQEALLRAGFIIADVRTLDKKQGSFRQIVSNTTVKQDLVISAYKPKESFKQSMIKHAGSEETAWDFVRQHLENIPVVVIKNDKIEVVAERQAYLLFDRMVAYHIMQGIPVPMDATDFYRGLDGKFLKRDGMYFLADQVNEYDTARIKTEVENVQFNLFVTNEKTAISWLYQQLSDEYGGSKTYAQIQPMFMQEVKAVDKYEDMPELQTILEENFLRDEDGRWYIPDVTKEGDVAKLREKNLLKEFEGYLSSKGKLKLFRSEAIRVGFSKLWKEKNYQAIVDLADRLPEATVQEDPNILMYYDISLGRI